MVLYPILLSLSWSTTVPNFMLVSGIAQSGQNLALSRLAISSLLEHMNQKLTELDTKLNNLVADLQPTGQNLNLNSSVAQSVQSNSDMNTPVIASNSHSRGDNSNFKVKPQNFSGGEDFDEFLSQFEITCEINRWQYREKSLYLANCLTGEARSLLSELDPDGRRDYSTLVEKLTNRFGSVNRSEIFRTQLKSRVRNKGESIPQLAQAVKKLVRQAYPRVNKDVVETLSIDHFIGAMTDSEIRLRVREFGQKTLGDAERTALRLESHKIADRQRSLLVGQVEVDSKHDKNENAKDANNEIKTLKSSLDALTSYVKDLTRPSEQIHDNSFRNGKFQPGQTFNRNGRYGRQYQSNPMVKIAVLVVNKGVTTLHIEMILTRLSQAMVQLTMHQGIGKTILSGLLILDMDLPSIKTTRETRISRFGGPQTDSIRWAH